MPYHVKSTGAMGTGTVYYEGGDSWTQTYADRKQFSAEADADAIKATNETRVIKNTSGTVCSTYTYKTKEYSNATVITE